MTELPACQVDAFTGRLFGGNPAAAVPLDSRLDEATMQAVAAENDLSETALPEPCGALSPSKDGYESAERVSRPAASVAVAFVNDGDPLLARIGLGD